LSKVTKVSSVTVIVEAVFTIKTLPMLNPL